MAAHFIAAADGVRCVPLYHALMAVQCHPNVMFQSDVPAIPPAYIASPVSLPRPPWAEPVNA